MRVFGPVKRVARRIHRRSWPRAVILMYHRVEYLQADPQLLAVTPEHFDQHLAIIRRRTQPIPLQELAERLQRGTIPDRSVVVTFDDGYADNLYNARSLLERYSVPATVFVTAGHVGCDAEFWWDELERLVLRPGVFPRRLRLDLDAACYCWDAGDRTEFTDADYQHHRDWHVERVDDPTPRHRLYRDLYQLLHSLSVSERRDVLAALRAWANTDSCGRPTHRALTRDELAKLASGNLIEIGAHTVTHQPLATLPKDDQWHEIAESKRLLEGELGWTITGFAYPHGSLTAETITQVRKAGISYACSSEPDAVWTDADRLQLPRVVVRDWDGARFDQWLRGWIGG